MDFLQRRPSDRTSTRRRSLLRALTPGAARRCPHYLCGRLSSPPFVLSLGLKRENMEVKLLRLQYVALPAAHNFLPRREGGGGKGGKNTSCSSDSLLLLPHPSPTPTSKALLSTHFLKARCSSLIHHPAAFPISSGVLSFFPPSDTYRRSDFKKETLSGGGGLADSAW